MNQSTENNFLNIFKGSLKITPRTISIKTLLSDRNLRRINYKPYYQRNYVWDNIKQTFFIESVLLGTEIPPLILFKSGSDIEVIDGRQRFETLKRFIENDFSLTDKGLLSLPALAKQNFNKLRDELKEIFWNSNIRVYEFEIIIDINANLEDKIKKEIFRRYNTGITPLTSIEVDSAKYDSDKLSYLFENELNRNNNFYNGVKKSFFYNELDSVDLKEKMIDFLRKSFVLSKFPISRYAQGKRRNETLSILYQAFVNTIEEIENDFQDFKSQIEQIFELNDFFFVNGLTQNNRLINESLLWAIRILQQEKIVHTCLNDKEQLLNYISKNLTVYSEDNSFYYKNIIERFTTISNYLNDKTNFDFEIYIKRNDFKETLKELTQTDQDADNVLNNLESLRINKPSPISKPIEEILSDVITYKYLIRPSYQRQEKISILKASAIIESILLGINLPPIFIYKRKDGVKEVIDGQQRLLSIIAFVGKQYIDENNSLTYSSNNSFKLKGLKVLNKNGQNFSSLSILEQDKILDFIIDEIIIEENLNDGFSATDLFIRLNQKPYPINNNSFEMWNSTIDNEVIKKLKEVTEKNISWFYSKERISGKTDRMENEELITILSYIIFNLKKFNSYEKVLGLFLRIDRITCRIKNKTALTDFLTKLDDNNTDKKLFLESIEKTEELINSFGNLFDSPLSKEILNDFFNVKNSKTFRRSYQDFYITWLVLYFKNDIWNKDQIKVTIREMLITLKNVNNVDVDEAYFDAFKIKLDSL